MILSSAEARAKRVADQDSTLTASERQQHAAATARPLGEIKAEAAERMQLAKERAAKRAEKAARKKEAKRAAKAAQDEAASGASDAKKDTAVAAAAAAAAGANAGAAAAGDNAPEWVGALATSPVQTHVFVLNFPFETDFAVAILPRLRAVADVVCYHVPTRALRPGSAFDQRILANLPPGTESVHRSQAVVQLATPLDVRAAVLALDGADAGGGREMRVVRARADATKLTADKNKAREHHGGAGAGGSGDANAGKGKKGGANKSGNNKGLFAELPSTNVALKKKGRSGGAFGITGDNAFAASVDAAAGVMGTGFVPLSEVDFTALGNSAAGGESSPVFSYGAAAAGGEQQRVKRARTKAGPGSAASDGEDEVELAKPVAVEEGEVEGEGEFYL